MYQQKIKRVVASHAVLHQQLGVTCPLHYPKHVGGCKVFPPRCIRRTQIIKKRETDPRGEENSGSGAGEKAQHRNKHIFKTEDWCSIIETH